MYGWYNILNTKCCSKSGKGSRRVTQISISQREEIGLCLFFFRVVGYTIIVSSTLTEISVRVSELMHYGIN